MLFLRSSTLTFLSYHFPQFYLHRLGTILSHGILACPLPSSTIVPLLISLEQLCNVRNKRIIRIRIGQERTNGQQHLGNCQSGAPLVLEDVQTDTSIGIDVAVIDTGGEVHFGWLEGVICREVNVKKEYSARIGGIVRSHDCSLPVEHIVSDRTGGAICGRIFTKIDKFFINSFERHFLLCRGQL